MVCRNRGTLQQEYGLNVLPERGPAPVWKIVLQQFASPLIYILLAAAVMSAIVGDLKDAMFIGFVLLLNAIIGSWQEWQAEKSSYALRKLLRMHAQVERDGEVREVKAEELVPGDIVWLESGNRVPADIRLLSAQGLEADESLLTGESLAVRKDSAWIGAAGVRHRIVREVGEPFALMISEARYHDLMIFGLRSLFESDLVGDPHDALVRLVRSGVRPPLAVSMGFPPIKKALHVIRSADQPLFLAQ